MSEERILLKFLVGQRVVIAAVRRAIEDDRFPRVPRLDPLRAALGRLEAAAEPTPHRHHHHRAGAGALMNVDHGQHLPLSWGASGKDSQSVGVSSKSSGA
jgi:hypothetical protein